MPDKEMVTLCGSMLLLSPTSPCSLFLFLTYTESLLQIDIHSIENPKQDTDINKTLTGFLSPSFDAFSTFLHEQEENT